MVLLNPLAFLCFIAVWSCMPSAVVERRVLCSSEKCYAWYTYDVFTIARIGYHVIVHYKGQLWLEHTEPDVPCEDAKICYIIKGETLHESFPLYMKKFYGPGGEYQVYLTVTIIDDLQGTMTLRFNLTLEVKNAGGGKNSLFPQLGVL